MLQRLALLWKRFTPLEEQLFAQIRTVLPDSMQLIFDAQVAAISRVQRLPPTWNEIDYFCRRNGRDGWSLVPPFPCTDEFRLAEVVFHVEGTRYRAALTSIQGHIFDFAIVPGPRRVAFAEWTEPARVTLLGDPRRAPTGHKEPEMLPPVWEDFLRRHQGEPSADWALYDATTSYRVAFRDAEYLTLAERDGPQFLLYRVGPGGRGFFCLRDPDGVPEQFLGDLDELIGSSGA
jgi:hypothetical protein